MGPPITQENKNRILRYFRDVDHGLHEILKSESVPVVFSGVDYLFPIYRQVNTYANLLDTFIPGNPDRLSPQAVHKAAWNQVSPVYHTNKDGAKAALRARRYLQQLPD
jgi:hypothetical protein